MPLGIGRHGSSDAVGLDLDGGYAAAVQTSHGRVTKAVSVDLPQGVMHDGEVADPGALGGALKAFFRANDLPKRVRLGVANQQIVVRQLELPRIEDPKERNAAIRFQAAEAVAMPLEDAVLDHQVVGEAITPEGSARMLVVVVAARRAMVDGLLEAARAAGLKPAGIDLNAFALVRLLAASSEADDLEDARAFIHLGAVTNLAIAVRRTCLFTRPLSVSVTPETDPETVAFQIADDLRPSLDFYRIQPNARQVADVVVSGPGADREGLAEALATHVGMPVEVAKPLGELDGPIFAPGDDPHRHTVAAGLAMGASE